MKLKDLKLELFFLRRAFLVHRSGLRYALKRFVDSRKILELESPLDRGNTRDDLSVHMLVGHKHIVMTLWSLGSFYSVSHMTGSVFLHSDGTITSKDREILKRLLPHAAVVDASTVVESSQKLRAFPEVREFRIKHQDNFFLTKLVDPFLVSDKRCRLILDCDILWFSHPSEIEDEINRGCDRSLMMLGGADGGKKSTNIVYFKDGTLLPQEFTRFNGGIILFRSDNLPLEKLGGYFARVDMSRQESRHFIEQSGYAYNLNNLHGLPADRYVIKSEVGAHTVAKHYTGPRREFFYISGLDTAYPLIVKYNSQQHSST